MECTRLPKEFNYDHVFGCADTQEALHFPAGVIASCLSASYSTVPAVAPLLLLCCSATFYIYCELAMAIDIAIAAAAAAWNAAAGDAC